MGIHKSTGSCYYHSSPIWLTVFFKLWDKLKRSTGCHPFYGWESGRNQKSESSDTCPNLTHPQVHLILSFKCFSDSTFPAVLWFRCHHLWPGSPQQAPHPCFPSSLFHTTCSQSNLLLTKSKSVWVTLPLKTCA